MGQAMVRRRAEAGTGLAKLRPRVQAAAPCAAVGAAYGGAIGAMFGAGIGLIGAPFWSAPVSLWFQMQVIGGLAGFGLLLGGLGRLLAGALLPFMANRRSWRLAGLVGGLASIAPTILATVNSLLTPGVVRHPGQELLRLFLLCAPLALGVGLAVYLERAARGGKSRLPGVRRAVAALESADALPGSAQAALTGERENTLVPATAPEGRGSEAAGVER